jgi:hypothetical protein
MPVPPLPPANAYLSSTPRPRYCWLHGYNNTHNGCNCNVMGTNRDYTSQMKAATSLNGTGGNPKIGVPVCLVFRLPLHHAPSFPIPTGAQELLVSLSCQLPLSSHSPLACMVPQTIEPPPHSINIKIIVYLINLTPMKTFEHPHCQRRSLRLRLKASPAYARGPAPHLTLNLNPPTPPLMHPLTLTTPTGLCPCFARPPNQTTSDKQLKDRTRQDPLHSVPPPLLLPHTLPTPTPSNLYPQIVSLPRIGWLTPLFS